jgi:hypothetical protein
VTGPFVEEEPPLAVAAVENGGAGKNSWRPLLTAALVVWALRIGIGVVIEKFGMLVLPAGSSLTGKLAHQFTFQVDSGSGLVGGLMHWDAGYYLSIAQHGYIGGVGHLNSTAAFFPLYPLLVGIVARILPIGHHPYELAALVVSWLALLAAICGIMAVVRQWTGNERYVDAGIAFAWFPVSVFLMAGYTESLFVALVAWTLYFCARDQMVVAAVLAGLCSATRMQGALVVIVIIWPVFSGGMGWLRATVLGVVSEAGLIAYGIFCWVHYGSPLAFAHAEKFWGRTLTIPFRPVEVFIRGWARGALHTGNQTGALALDAFLGLGALVATVLFVVWAHRRPGLGGVAVLTVLLLLEAASTTPNGVPEAMGRYVMCIVPLYALVPVVVRRIPGSRAALMASAAIAGCCQILFTLGYWLT